MSNRTNKILSDALNRTAGMLSNFIINQAAEQERRRYYENYRKTQQDIEDEAAKAKQGLLNQRSDIVNKMLRGGEYAAVPPSDYSGKNPAEITQPQKRFVRYSPNDYSNLISEFYRLGGKTGELTSALTSYGKLTSKPKIKAVNTAEGINYYELNKEGVPTRLVKQVPIKKTVSTNTYYETNGVEYTRIIYNDGTHKDFPTGNTIGKEAFASASKELSKKEIIRDYTKTDPEQRQKGLNEWSKAYTDLMIRRARDMVKFQINPDEKQMAENAYDQELSALRDTYTETYMSDQALGIAKTLDSIAGGDRKKMLALFKELKQDYQDDAKGERYPDGLLREVVLWIQMSYPQTEGFDTGIKSLEEILTEGE